MNDFVRKRKIIGRNVRGRRKVLDLLQRDLAEPLDTSIQRIGRVEQGKAGLEFQEVTTVCEILNINDPKMLLEENAFYPEKTSDR